MQFMPPNTPTTMYKILITNCLLAILAVPLSAQMLKYQDVPISRAGSNLSLATAGGTEAPQYSPIDLDNDGKLDLLVFDRAASVALTFLNIGAAGEIKYQFAPDFMSRFPQRSTNFMFVRDYNCDGISDLIYYYQIPTGGSGIRVMRGSYDSQSKIQFTPVTDALLYDFEQFDDQSIFIYNPDVPAIEDIDGDGDLDIMAFALDFTFARNVFFYKNMSQERGFGCDSLQFVLFNRCFGQFSEFGSNNTVIYTGTTDSCADNQYWRNPRHLGSSLAAIDYNGDGNKDLIMGDVSVNSLNMLTMSNIGDTLVVTAQDSTFPSYNVSVSLLSFPAAYFLDVNNDGITDMIAANSELAYPEAVTDSTSWLYLNTGSNSNMQFSLHDKAFMYGDMVDVGREAHPAAVDFDGDGLLDLVVGNSYNTRNNRSVSASLTLFRNVGTATAPAFEQTIANVGNLAALNLPSLYPTFGDLDGDGDMDLLVGANNGTFIFVENTAGIGNPMQFAAPQTNFANITAFGSFAAPQLYDLDGDGDLDIIAGENTGNLNWFENTGSAANYNFATTPNNAQFGLVALNVAGSRRSVPHFYYNTQTQSTELLLGHEQGSILRLGNIDGNLSGKFDTLDADYNNIYMGKYSALALADFDGDTIPDIVVGNARGGFTFFTSQADTITNIIDWSADLDRRAQLYPNPTTGLTTLNLPTSSRLNTRINVYTSVGFLMQTYFFPGSNTNCQLDLSRLKDGIYMVEVWSNGRRSTYRVVLLPH
jgi:hypothetical protein